MIAARDPSQPRAAAGALGAGGLRRRALRRRRLGRWGQRVRPHERHTHRDGDPDAVQEEGPRAPAAHVHREAGRYAFGHRRGDGRVAGGSARRQPGRRPQRAQPRPEAQAPRTVIRPRLPLLLAVLAAALGAAAPAAAAVSPRIAAQGAIVVDAATGDVAYAKAPDARRAIASTTKLMTALLALEDGGLSEVVPAVRYRA